MRYVKKRLKARKMPNTRKSLRNSKAINQVLQTSENEVFKTFTAAAWNFGVTARQISYAVETGKKIEGVSIFRSDPHVAFSDDGFSFPSFEDMASFYNVPYATLVRMVRLEQYWTFRTAWLGWRTQVAVRYDQTWFVDSIPIRNRKDVLWALRYLIGPGDRTERQIALDTAQQSGNNVIIKRQTGDLFK